MYAPASTPPGNDYDCGAKQRSTVLIDNLTISNGHTRNNFYCSLNGEEAHLDLDGLGILMENNA